MSCKLFKVLTRSSTKTSFRTARHRLRLPITQFSRCVAASVLHKTAFITYANVSSAAQRKLPGPKLDSHRHRAYLQYNQRELSMRLTRLNTSSAYLPGTRLGLGQCVPFSYITLYSSYPLSPETLYRRGYTRHETIDKDLIITF